MNTRFKGYDHPVQGLAGPRLVPPYMLTTGTPIRYDGEVIGEIEAVVDDTVVVKIQPGCEEKFKKFLACPGIIPSICSRMTGADS